MSEEQARYGWQSAFPEFRETEPSKIRSQLQAYITDASPEQLRAWQQSIPPLQKEVSEVLIGNELAKHYSTILEYELPLESRRPDVILLVGHGVLVVELKGKIQPSQADIDQAAAYARDLACYHRECWQRPVVPILVPTRAQGYFGKDGQVHITGFDALDELIREIAAQKPGPVIDREKFLAESAYSPLPSLVEAARELFQSGKLRAIHRAKAATDPAVQNITEIIHHAAASKTRHLVLVTGVPGSGKTLVGLQIVHAHFLDDLAIPRSGNKPSTPAVFLSGNGPLVEVLQYELRSAGGGGKTFVRGVKDYVKTYSARPGLVPPEHVLVFDEAQRAFDAEMVAEKHAGQRTSFLAKSEPEHFIEFAERIPEWCVVIGLIGGGQEIHVGEEAGLIQWRWAVERSEKASQWTLHAPPSVAENFSGSKVPCNWQLRLNLDVELRFHQAKNLHHYVAELLAAKPINEVKPLAEQLEQEGYHLRITRDLEVAKDYLRTRYAEDQQARFGIIASSKDKDLLVFGVANDFQSTKRVRVGPWYGDHEKDIGTQSCRLLETCVTEFGAQGLELDAALLAWGTDLKMVNGVWSNVKARGYLKKALVRNPFQLRVNAYRVLLTRGRDGCVIFMPPLPELDETFAYLVAAGWKEL